MTSLQMISGFVGQDLEKREVREEERKDGGGGGGGVVLNAIRSLKRKRGITRSLRFLLLPSRACPLT